MSSIGGQLTRACASSCNQGSFNVFGLTTNTTCCTTDYCNGPFPSQPSNSASFQSLEKSALIILLLAVLFC